MLAYQHHQQQLPTNTTTPQLSSQPKLPSNEQLQIMFGRIEEQLKSALEKLSLIYKWTNSDSSSAHACQLLRQYQDTAWPLLIEVDERLKELASYLRKWIDSCHLNDSKLNQLLCLNRRHTDFTNICRKLSREMDAELRDVLELRSRTAQIQGINLSPESNQSLEEMLKKLGDNKSED